MTFSIVAQCPETGQFGVAAATEMPAVGKLLSYARAGIGAVATQALLNPYLGIDGIDWLTDGMSASATLAALKRQDPRINLRQVAVIDRFGRTAVWTGPQCLAWAGAIPRDGYAIQGNRLTGPEVLDALDHTMASTAGLPLADRFMEALEAADALGGDRQGEHSATIYIVDTEEYPLWDIRVDHHARPMQELRRLHDVFAEQLLPEIKRMPTRANPAGAADSNPA